MDIETWYKTACNSCFETNWICNGNVEDQTVSDVEGFICWNCAHPNQLGYGEGCGTEEFFVEGLEKPT